MFNENRLYIYAGTLHNYIYNVIVQIPFKRQVRYQKKKNPKQINVVFVPLQCS